SLAGAQAGKAIEAVQAVSSPENALAGRTATALGLATLMFGAFAVFHHLQEALNSIWRVERPATKGWWGFLRQRLFSFATVVGTGFLLLVSLIASALLSWLSDQAFARFELPTPILQAVNFLLSFGMLTF